MFIEGKRQQNKLKKCQRSKMRIVKEISVEELETKYSFFFQDVC